MFWSIILKRSRDFTAFLRRVMKTTCLLLLGRRSVSLRKAANSITDAPRYRFCATGNTARFHLLLEYFYNPEFFANHRSVIPKSLIDVKNAVQTTSFMALHS